MTKPISMPWVIGAIVICLVVAGGYWLIGSKNPMSDDLGAAAIRRMLGQLNDPRGEELRQKFNAFANQFIAGSPNRTNCGAEILHAFFSSSSSVDTDSDGLIEAVDRWGEPVVFLFPGMRTDVLVYPGGGERKVPSPPYLCPSSYYIGSLRCHYWYESDEMVLRGNGLNSIADCLP